ncbi:response regulator [Rhodocytophaga aerolata]|uniref:Response regulator n=1 Tax=Rhodocytophaga aerolata TaxID=455078 RepID=A0ABT8RIB4_9BACT|nr:response regulator [Rhodocytophaga aerolata]MDO1450417.1 response regulator [Rhodocytophaga aerolata]
MLIKIVFKIEGAIPLVAGSLGSSPLACQKNFSAGLFYSILVAVFDDAISASEFLRQTSVDILFVDIQMPDISGIDLVRTLKKTYHYFYYGSQEICL